MAFNRLLKLAIGPAPPAQGVEFETLDIDFRVMRSVTFSENTCELAIYNVTETTRNDILIKGNNVILKAGYEDEVVSTIFIGNITEALSFKKGKDTVTKVTASATRSENKPFEYTIFSASFGKTTKVSQVINQIAQTLGLVVFGLENANISMPNGFVHAGSARAALAKCKKILKANGADLYIDNNELVIYRTEGRTSSFQAAYLDSDSGLLSVGPLSESKADEEEKKDKTTRLEFIALLNPAIKPNSVITIKSVAISGSYFVDMVEFYGNNYGGDFNCRGEVATA